jgi:hypothetical protein
MSMLVFGLQRRVNLEVDDVSEEHTAAILRQFTMKMEAVCFPKRW